MNKRHHISTHALTAHTYSHRRSHTYTIAHPSGMPRALFRTDVVAHSTLQGHSPAPRTVFRQSIFWQFAATSKEGKTSQKRTGEHRREGDRKLRGEERTGEKGQEVERKKTRRKLQHSFAKCTQYFYPSKSTPKYTSTTPTRHLPQAPALTPYFPFRLHI